MFGNTNNTHIFAQPCGKDLSEGRITFCCAWQVCVIQYCTLRHRLSSSNKDNNIKIMNMSIVKCQDYHSASFCCLCIVNLNASELQLLAKHSSLYVLVFFSCFNTTAHVLNPTKKNVFSDSSFKMCSCSINAFRGAHELA